MRCRRLYRGARDEPCGVVERARTMSSKRCAQVGLVAAGVVLVSCLGVLFAFSPKNEPIVLSIPTGDQAPSFHLKDLNGHAYDSEAMLGKAIVVFFSSVRCSTCAEYQDRVTELARQYQGDGRV